MGRNLVIPPMWRARSVESEWLDELSLQGKDLEQSLQQLAYINRFLGAHRAILAGLQVLRRRQRFPPGQTIRIVDLGCGGGDLLCRIAKWGRKQGLSLVLIGIDGNPNSLAYARKKAAAYPEISFSCQDLLQNPALPAQTDLIVSSHFLYHYADEALGPLLQSWLIQAKIGFLTTDLIRHPLAYMLFKLMNLILPTHPMVRHDGLLAIRRAFRLSELRAILTQISASEISLKPFWAFRFQLLMLV